MTRYVRALPEWVPFLHVECECSPAWKDRGMIDRDCWFHELIDAIEDLRDLGWTVEPPDALA